jgi:hypothetical protein
MVDFQVLIVCSIAGIIFLYVLARSVPHKVSSVAYMCSRIGIYAESQLDHIPAIGPSGRLTSYLGVLRHFRGSYNKVRFIPVNAAFLRDIPGSCIL